MSLDIVVTGIGVVSPVGIGQVEFWDALASGQSGVIVRPNFSETELPARIFAPVVGFEGKNFVKPRKSIKVMCLPIQHGYAAAKLAFEASGLKREDLDADRIGTVFGTETFFADPLEVADVFRKCTIDKEYQHERWGEFAMREIQPLWMLKYLPNMVASHISIAMDARGPSNSICQAEASSLLSIIEGANLIQRGVADVVICGGTGCRLSLSAMLYRGFENLSKKIDQPSSASRPFDKNRDGLVAGEGAGAIVLESAAHARARGKKPIARIAGWARTFADPASGDPSIEISQHLEMALQHANLTSADIGHYHAHATGEVQGDREEAQAVARTFGDVPVYAPKGNFGHLGPGGASVELCAALLAMQKRTLPPNINMEQFDSECPVNASQDSVPINTAVGYKLTRSFTGQLASIVFDDGV